ncbi:MAG: hypothetical protein ACHQ7N_16865, partial [Candidatus Methylomirabilales bacterium]
DSSGYLWLYFGTGDRNHPNANATNRLYGIKDANPDDTTNGNTLTEASLVNVTSTNATGASGWYFTLATKEKVLASVDVFNNIAYFTTFTPTATTACDSGGGIAKEYAVQITTGYAAVDWTNGAVPLTSTNSAQTRYKTIGSGIPSKPIVIITDSGTTLTTSVVAATTSQQLPSNPAPPPSSMRRVLYWREAF